MTDKFYTYKESSIKIEPETYEHDNLSQASNSLSSFDPDIQHLLDNSSQSESSLHNKVCSFCYLGENSWLGQGNLLKFEKSNDDFDVSKMDIKYKMEDNINNSNLSQISTNQILKYSSESSGSVISVGNSQQILMSSIRKSKGTNRNNPKCKRKNNFSQNVPGLDELNATGFPIFTEISVLFDSSGATWAHELCIVWSEGIILDSSYNPVNVDKIVIKSMTQQCYLCKNYGASLPCQVHGCSKKFHFPCGTSFGTILDIHNNRLLCRDHTPLSVLEDDASICKLCQNHITNLSHLLTCLNCGSHCHSTCVKSGHKKVANDARTTNNMVASIENSADNEGILVLKPHFKAGWRCTDCKTCQICKSRNDISKLAICEDCDKAFHTFCLKPPILTVPKMGWKCKNCRICLDCGTRTPGAGLSSRWHSNYTLCDSCYQQRNKSHKCSVCKRVVVRIEKAISVKNGGINNQTERNNGASMVKCGKCDKFVHNECDTKAAEHSDFLLNNLATNTEEFICSTCCSEAHNFFKVSNRIKDGGRHAKKIGVSCHNSNIIHRPTNSPDGDIGIVNIGPVSIEVSEVQRYQDKGSGDDDLLKKTKSSNNRDYISPPALKLTLKKHVENNQYTVVVHDTAINTLINQVVGQFRQTPVLIPSGGNEIGTVIEFDTKTLNPTSGENLKYSQNTKNNQILENNSNTSNFYNASNNDRGGGERINSFSQRQDDDANKSPIVFDPPSVEDDDDEPAYVPILFSKQDKFTYYKDVCACCGSFGAGTDSLYVFCFQCGQSYHPFCVSVEKLTIKMLVHGWRCFKCIICEICGRADDEARLILCDDCDIAYHTYCLKPPLSSIPKGSWKCQNCICCETCLSTSPGKNCSWITSKSLPNPPSNIPIHLSINIPNTRKNKNKKSTKQSLSNTVGYECGPCSSRETCPACRKKYSEMDIIMECGQCERWIHGACENIKDEWEAGHALEKGFTCKLCKALINKHSSSHTNSYHQLCSDSCHMTGKIKELIKEFKDNKGNKDNNWMFTHNKPIKSTIEEVNQGISIKGENINQNSTLNDKEMAGIKEVKCKEYNNNDNTKEKNEPAVLISSQGASETSIYTFQADTNPLITKNNDIGNPIVANIFVDSSRMKNVHKNYDVNSMTSCSYNTEVAVLSTHSSSLSPCVSQNVSQDFETTTIKDPFDTTSQIDILKSVLKSMEMLNPDSTGSLNIPSSLSVNDNIYGGGKEFDVNISGNCTRLDIISNSSINNFSRKDDFVLSPQIKTLSELNFGSTDIAISKQIGGDYQDDHHVTTKSARRNSNKLGSGVGGFYVRPKKQTPIFPPNATLQHEPEGNPSSIPQDDHSNTLMGSELDMNAYYNSEDKSGSGCGGIKRKRAPKKRGYLAENYPYYLQELFFGESLLKCQDLERRLLIFRSINPNFPSHSAGNPNFSIFSPCSEDGNYNLSSLENFFLTHLEPISKNSSNDSENNIQNTNTLDIALKKVSKLTLNLEELLALDEDGKRREIQDSLGGNSDLMMMLAHDCLLEGETEDYHSFPYIPGWKGLKKIMSLGDKDITEKGIMDIIFHTNTISDTKTKVNRQILKPSGYFEIAAVLKRLSRPKFPFKFLLPPQPTRINKSKYMPEIAEDASIIAVNDDKNSKALNQKDTNVEISNKDDHRNIIDSISQNAENSNTDSNHHITITKDHMHLPRGRERYPYISMQKREDEAMIDVKQLTHKPSYHQYLQPQHASPQAGYKLNQQTKLQINNNQERPQASSFVKQMQPSHNMFDGEPRIINSFIKGEGIMEALPQMNSNDVEELLGREPNFDNGKELTSNIIYPPNNYSLCNQIYVSHANLSQRYSSMFNNRMQATKEFSTFFRQDVPPQHALADPYNVHGRSIRPPKNVDPPPCPTFLQSHASAIFSRDLDELCDKDSGPSHTQRNLARWQRDESLGIMATISPVLYANLMYPSLKREVPDILERSKQMAKLWRNVLPEDRIPYLQKARENRAFLRLQKSQQKSLEHQSIASVTTSNKNTTSEDLITPSPIFVQPQTSSKVTHLVKDNGDDGLFRLESSLPIKIEREDPLTTHSSQLSFDGDMNIIGNQNFNTTSYFKEDSIAITPIQSHTNSNHVIKVEINLDPSLTTNSPSRTTNSTYAINLPSAPSIHIDASDTLTECPSITAALLSSPRISEMCSDITNLATSQYQNNFDEHDSLFLSTKIIFDGENFNSSDINNSNIALYEKNNQNLVEDPVITAYESDVLTGQNLETADSRFRYDDFCNNITSEDLNTTSIRLVQAQLINNTPDLVKDSNANDQFRTESNLKIVDHLATPSCQPPFDGNMNITDDQNIDTTHDTKEDNIVDIAGNQQIQSLINSDHVIKVEMSLDLPLIVNTYSSCTTMSTNLINLPSTSSDHIGTADKLPQYSSTVTLLAMEEKNPLANPSCQPSLDGNMNFKGDLNIDTTHHFKQGSIDDVPINQQIQIKVEMNLDSPPTVNTSFFCATNLTNMITPPTTLSILIDAPPQYSSITDTLLSQSRINDMDSKINNITTSRYQNNFDSYDQHTSFFSAKNILDNSKDINNRFARYERNNQNIVGNIPAITANEKYPGTIVDNRFLYDFRNLDSERGGQFNDQDESMFMGAQIGIEQQPKYPFKSPVAHFHSLQHSGFPAPSLSIHHSAVLPIVPPPSFSQHIRQFYEHQQPPFYSAKHKNNALSLNHQLNNVAIFDNNASANNNMLYGTVNIDNLNSTNNIINNEPLNLTNNILKNNILMHINNIKTEESEQFEYNKYYHFSNRSSQLLDDILSDLSSIEETKSIFKDVSQEPGPYNPGPINDNNAYNLQKLPPNPWAPTSFDPPPVKKMAIGGTAWNNHSPYNYNHYNMGDAPLNYDKNNDMLDTNNNFYNNPRGQVLVGPDTNTNYPSDFIHPNYTHPCVNPNNSANDKFKETKPTVIYNAGIKKEFLQQPQQEGMSKLDDENIMGQIDFEKLNEAFATRSFATPQDRSSQDSFSIPGTHLMLNQSSPTFDSDSPQKHHRSSEEYRSWLYKKDQTLQNSLSNLSSDIAKLRKRKKSLASKQRQLKKSGGGIPITLPLHESRELLALVNDIGGMQKRIEGLRKEMKQHKSLLSDWQGKKETKLHQPRTPNPNLFPPLNPNPFNTNLANNQNNEIQLAPVNNIPVQSRSDIIIDSPLVEIPSNPINQNQINLSPHQMLNMQNMQHNEAIVRMQPQPSFQHGINSNLIRNTSFVPSGFGCGDKGGFIRFNNPVNAPVTLGRIMDNTKSLAGGPLILPPHSASTSKQLQQNMQNLQHSQYHNDQTIKEDRKFLNFPNIPSHLNTHISHPTLNNLINQNIKRDTHNNNNTSITSSISSSLKSPSFKKSHNLLSPSFVKTCVGGGFNRMMVMEGGAGETMQNSQMLPRNYIKIMDGGMRLEGRMGLMRPPVFNNNAVGPRFMHHSNHNQLQLQQMNFQTNPHQQFHQYYKRLPPPHQPKPLMHQVQRLPSNPIHRNNDNTPRNTNGGVSKGLGNFNMGAGSERYLTRLPAASYTPFGLGNVDKSLPLLDRRFGRFKLAILPDYYGEFPYGRYTLPACHAMLTARNQPKRDSLLRELAKILPLPGDIYQSVQDNYEDSHLLDKEIAAITKERDFLKIFDMSPQYSPESASIKTRSSVLSFSRSVKDSECLSDNEAENDYDILKNKSIDEIMFPNLFSSQELQSPLDDSIADTIKAGDFTEKANNDICILKRDLLHPEENYEELQAMSPCIPLCVPLKSIGQRGFENVNNSDIIEFPKLEKIDAKNEEIMTDDLGFDEPPIADEQNWDETDEKVSITLTLDVSSSKASIADYKTLLAKLSSILGLKTPVSDYSIETGLVENDMTNPVSFSLSSIDSRNNGELKMNETKSAEVDSKIGDQQRLNHLTLSSPLQKCVQCKKFVLLPGISPHSLYNASFCDSNCAFLYRLSMASRRVTRTSWATLRLDDKGNSNSKENYFKNESFENLSPNQRHLFKGRTGNQIYSDDKNKLGPIMADDYTAKTGNEFYTHRNTNNYDKMPSVISDDYNIAKSKIKAGNDSYNSKHSTTRHIMRFEFRCLANGRKFKVWSSKISPPYHESKMIALTGYQKLEVVDKFKMDALDTSLLSLTASRPYHYEIRKADKYKVDEISKASDHNSPFNDKEKETLVDTRVCLFCRGLGDGSPESTSRLLNLSPDRWVHLNCALWSSHVYETLGGALVNVPTALNHALSTKCHFCASRNAADNLEGLSPLPYPQINNSLGASCICQECERTYHFACALMDGCLFFSDKTIICPKHKSITQTLLNNAKFNEDTRTPLTSLACDRRVYIDRDFSKQLSEMMQNSDKYTLRIGTLIFSQLGYLLPEHIPNFHDLDYIYPVKYKAIRYYWDYKAIDNKHVIPRRRAYECCIDTSVKSPEGKYVPEFIVNSLQIVITLDEGIDIKILESFRGETAKAAWQPFLTAISEIRSTPSIGSTSSNSTIRLVDRALRGEDLFGLTDPPIIRLVESLPLLVNSITIDYRFKYGRNQGVELPLMTNPSGSARTEPNLRTHFRKPLILMNAPLPPKHHLQCLSSSQDPSEFLTLNPTLSVPALNASLTPQATSYLSAALVFGPGTHPSILNSQAANKTSLYRKMKCECLKNVYLGKSRIQGMGLFAARDFDRDSMIIEYVGELIRSEVAEVRERSALLASAFASTYFFRLDDHSVLDATRSGGPARYINHSCDPNCRAQTITIFVSSASTSVPDDSDIGGAILNLPTQNGSGQGKFLAKTKKIVIVANKKIQRGEELCYDYKFEYEGENNKLSCLCGAHNCKKWMN
ncbi:uncharacterized protein LOC135926748 [Gordionus sp. m RMFG-2023]|uniref:uncharacterized protein LOC135926748 n=1 Tax=Gordionus sp. m RMFG-2023 TaxID=3053472 RepID=UPI0031FC32E6